MDQTRTLYFAFVGAVGDLPFQAKIWKQSRNFQCLSCCPFCLANKDDIADVSDDPSWLLDEVPMPWLEDSHVARIPGMGSACMARHDIFHLGHLGISRHFYCSALVVLAQFFGHFGDRSLALDKKLAAAYQQFKGFCRMVGESPLVKEFTKTNMHAAETEFPDSSFKASDSVLIMKFLEYYLDLPLWFDREGVMQTMLETTASYNAFYRACWGAADRRWMTRQEATFAMKQLDAFIRGYVLLATWAHRAGSCHWVLVPKLHYLKHLSLDMGSALKNPTLRYFYNPANWSTPDGEDFVGHISRPMRDLHSASSSLRRLQMHQAELHREWRR